MKICDLVLPEVVLVWKVLPSFLVVPPFIQEILDLDFLIWGAAKHTGMLLDAP